MFSPCFRAFRGSQYVSAVRRLQPLWKCARHLHHPGAPKAIADLSVWNRSNRYIFGISLAIYRCLQAAVRKFTPHLGIEDSDYPGCQNQRSLVYGLLTHTLHFPSLSLDPQESAEIHRHFLTSKSNPLVNNNFRKKPTPIHKLTLF